jgi:Pentatricopeptide repeat domain
VTLQIHSNPLKDPDLPARFARLIIKHMIRLSVSDDQVVGKLKAAPNGLTKSNVSSLRRYKENKGGQPTAQTIGLYQDALGFSESEVDELLYPGQQQVAGHSIINAVKDHFAELHVELRRQSNLPYEVQKDRAAALAAIADDNFIKAREHLTAAAVTTNQMANYAVEEYAGSIAALGNLAFTELDFAEARVQFGNAIALAPLSNERRTRYRRSYLVASNAVMAKSASYEDGRVTLNEMIVVGVEPNVVTFNTLINLTKDYATGRAVLDEMIKEGLEPDVTTFSTLINLTKDYATGRAVLDEMIKEGVKPNVTTFSTLINLTKDYAMGRAVLDEMIKEGVKPNELSLITLVKRAPSFEVGCALAFEAREAGKEWSTGRGFCQALCSLPITHLSADAFLELFRALPFRFDTALEGPIGQYRRNQSPAAAMSLCLYAPHVPAAKKFYRENFEFCVSFLLDFPDADRDESNFHYCFGIAAHENKDWKAAKENLLKARELAYAEPRIAYIDEMMNAIPSI